MDDADVTVVEVTVTFTYEELEAIKQWAGLAGQGFHEGPSSPAEEAQAAQEPGNTALAKVEKALA